jgi:hypothetical protein
MVLPATESPAATAPLSDVMLAMDVVDTLRHTQAEVARELSNEDRALQLKKRLREIYAAQGIEVPDQVLDEGVKGIAAARFAYEPTPPSWQRSVAHAWVARARWGRPLGLALAVLVVGALGWHFGVSAPEARRVAAERIELMEGLPRAVDGMLQRIAATNPDQAARAEAERLAAEARAAASASDLGAAREKQAALQSLLSELARAYRVRVVQRPGEPSGVWRVPATNARAQNFYLIVEAVDARGQPTPVRVTSEENQRTAETAKWGLRVPQAVFQAVARDKQDDGIIQGDIVGEKRVGELVPRFRVETSGAAILQW